VTSSRSDSGSSGWSRRGPPGVLLAPRLPLAEKLIAEAERDAELAIGLLRAGAAAILLVWMNLSFLFDPPTGPGTGNTRIVTLALTGFLLVGLASFALARAGLFRPWLAFAFSAVDAAAVSLGLFLVLDTAGLGGNWLPAVPAVWLLPLLMSLGAIRYRPWVQVWSTALMLLGLLIVVGILGFDRHGPSNGAGGQVGHLFSMTPMVIRGLLLALAGVVGAIVMWRAQALLLRAVAEASRRTALTRFLPTEIAPLVDSPDFGQWREGRRQQVTMLFVDMRDSTERSEPMDPTRLSIFMASFRRRILRAADASGGVVDKFIGDGALILFGIPDPRPDDSARALQCARELLKQIDRWNLKRNFDPPVRIGIGVHSGDVYCGLVGDDTRLEFTVLGDAVNAAARVEQATKRFGVPLLASEPVVEAAGEAGRWHFVTDQPLRGRSNFLAILAPSGEDVPSRQSRLP